MDEILKAVFVAEKPVKDKRLIFQAFLQSAETKVANIPEEQQKNIFTNCIKVYLSGDNFHSKYAGLIIKEYLPFCQNAINEVINGRMAESVLIGQPENELSEYLFRRFSLTNMLLSGTSADSKAHRHFVLIVKSEIVRLMYASKDHVTFAEICRLLIAHPTCMPAMSRNFSICSLSIHAMSDFVLLKSDRENLNNYLKDVQDVAKLLAHVWSKAPNILFPSLKEVFNILCDNKTEPSNALGCLVELIPAGMIEEAVKQITHDPTILDTSMYLALTRMVSWLGWPTAQNTHLWIQSFFKQLAELNKFQMLIDVTLKTIAKVVICITIPFERQSAVTVLCHMLISYQASPEAFHIVAPHIPRILQLLENEKLPKVNDMYIKQIANLCYCMMHLHTGFPELYDPIIQAISKHPKPNDEEITSALNVPKWASDAMPLKFYAFQAARSTETDMAGLVNMGNTCYMNSIIQALFMAEEFRRLMLIDVRGFPLKSVSKSLERTFAFLLKTKREAYRPAEMVGCSTPAWFTSGAQQDCSEYVKHLIDVLSSEYKEHFQESAMSTAGQSTLSNAESPATLPVRRNSESETSIYNLFHGKLRTSIKCLTCDFISMREESFLDLALPLNKAHEREIPVPGKGGSEMGLDPNPDAAPQPVTQEPENVPMDTERGTSAFVEGNETVFQGQAVQVEEDFEEEEMDIRRTYDLEDLINENLLDETLDGSNKYSCTNCNELRKAQKKTLLTDLPMYLMITLMRFTYNTKLQRRTKVMDHVNIPQEVEIPVTAENDVETYIKYKLWAVVVHSGTSAESGHYYCYGNKLSGDSNRWFLFNDSHVSFAPFSSIKNLTGRYAVDTPYMLMYMKTDSITPVQCGDEIISESLLAEIKEDDDKFKEEQKLASERATCATKTNILGWSNDNNPPPPSCGGGDGGNFGSSRLVC